VVALLMGAQAALGILFRGQYRDVEWIRATWLGNDWVTLVVAAPLLARGDQLARRGSSRGYVVTLGLLAYAIYNYAFYLFGAALSVFFPIYVALCLLAAWALAAAIRLTDWPALGGSRQIVWARPIGGYFVVVGVLLAAAWLGMWAAYSFFGQATPVDTDAFRLVAALDLLLMVPLLLAGGVLLWRRRSIGHWIGAAAGVQASLYLTVLSVNSVLAVRSGRVDAPGEFPLWGTLAVLTIVAALVLLRSLREPRARSHAAASWRLRCSR
jgi:hypothetical protein